ncbi:hypothetical protein FISHEDRAFT_49706, partial [Fistulina hepatica ATCC 64428]
CTRWFAPLFILPTPTAPPFYLLIFALTLTFHSKPCFYCVILVSTLFASSCYWQPFPIDAQLSVPWSKNVTTFRGALAESLGLNYTQPLPTEIRLIDRCWCDFSGSSSIFEPFNVQEWELASVLRLRNELRQKQRREQAREEREGSRPSSAKVAAPTTAPEQESLHVQASSSSAPVESSPLPLFRSHYDLRPYGYGMVVDFGWTR